MEQKPQNPKPKAALPANHCIVHKYTLATDRDGKQFVAIAVTGTVRPVEQSRIPIYDDKNNVIAYVRGDENKNADVKYGSFIPVTENNKTIAPNSVEFYKLQKMWPIGKPLTITRNGKEIAFYLMSNQQVIAKIDNPKKGHVKDQPIGGLYKLELNPELL